MEEQLSQVGELETLVKDNRMGVVGQTLEKLDMQLAKAKEVGTVNVGTRCEQYFGGLLCGVRATT